MQPWHYALAIASQVPTFVVVLTHGARVRVLERELAMIHERLKHVPENDDVTKLTERIGGLIERHDQVLARLENHEEWIRQIAEKKP